MAEFMAGVLDHSNARPAGVSIQASKTSGFGDVEATIAVSYRDDSFAPMVDVSIKTFFSGNNGTTDGVGKFDDDGGCETASDCAWTDDESLTDGSGNIFITDGGAANGTMNTYYAWMGDTDADNNDFNVDKDHASVTLSSTTDAVNLKVTTDINKNSTAGNTVDIDSGKSVTLTAQLVDGNGEPVAKAGVEVSMTVVQGGLTLYPGPAPTPTDDDGQVTYALSGPKSTKGALDKDRTDTVQFRADVNGNDDIGDPASTASDPSEDVTATVVWTDSNPTLATAEATQNADNEEISRSAVGTGKGSVPAYVLRNSKNEVTIRATVSFYDQYGNPTGKGNSISITIPDAAAKRRTISSRGMASWRATVTAATLGSTISVTYTDLQNAEGTALSGVTVEATPVLAVEHAPDDSSNDAADIAAVYGDEDRFLIAGLLYSYDDDDVFISDSGDDVDGNVVDLDGFEKLIGANMDAQPTTQANIEIVAYDDDGTSIFRVVTAAQ
jgi:hypothetical protein